MDVDGAWSADACWDVLGTVDVEASAIGRGSILSMLDPACVYVLCSKSAAYMGGLACDTPFCVPHD